MAKKPSNCPEATQYLSTNLKNRNHAIKEVGYGPLNPELDEITLRVVAESNKQLSPSARKAALTALLDAYPTNYDFWIQKAMLWTNTDLRTVMTARCANCTFFDTSPEMMACIDSGVAGSDKIDTHDMTGDLGYCVALKFKCAASRTCDAWAVRATKKKGSL